MEEKLKKKNEILDNHNERYCEIYLITNTDNGKKYVGQAVSHILNHGRYRPYGSYCRFNCHVSEALSTKPNQSHFLNNAIRKYGKEKFVVNLLECCEIHDSDAREIFYISHYNTLFPNGYNLKNGGQNFTHCDESKKRVSNGVRNYYKDKKYLKFQSVDKIDDDIEKYIRPLNRENKQYGWYVYINRIKADFGGQLIPLDESRCEAVDFILTLKSNLAKPLDAGSP